MGLAGSQVHYEGYGKTQLEALQSLDSLLRYHPDNATIHKEEEEEEEEEEEKERHEVAPGHQELRNNRFVYYVWDGKSCHYLAFSTLRGWWRVFIKE